LGENESSLSNRTLEVVAEMAVLHARAGADVAAPSDVMTVHLLMPLVVVSRGAGRDRSAR